MDSLLIEALQKQVALLEQLVRTKDELLFQLYLKNMERPKEPKIIYGDEICKIVPPYSIT